MSITRKPKVPTFAQSPTVDPLVLIQRGGSSASQAAKKPYEGTTAVILRVPTDILKRVDQVLRARPLRAPRHTWILEAILEKLSNEENHNA